MEQTRKNFDFIKIKLVSPNRILKWSERELPSGEIVGEVKNPETINYRTFKPEVDGLFCERIFGPIKNFECSCGKYKKIHHQGFICDQCGVELTGSRARRYRMGHIKLSYPVSHLWYLNGNPNYMALLLEVEQCEKRIDTGILYDIPDIYDLINTTLELRQDSEIKTALKNIIKNYKQKLSKNNNSEKKLSKKQILLNILEQYSQSKISIKAKEIKENLKKLLNIFKINNNSELSLFQIYQQEYQKKLAIKSGKVSLNDNRIKRIKLIYIAYFISKDETSFYGLHWDLQQYRRSRELGFTGYPVKPKIDKKYTNFVPKYLIKAIPNNLIGSALIRKELEKLDLNKEIVKTRNFITICSKVLQKEKPAYNFSKWFRKWEYQRIYKLRDQSIKRIRILENLLATGCNPSWMILTILPVLPPSLRPMIQLEGGRFATSDLNELYKRIITRNNRLIRLIEIDAPQIIVRNEKRMLQEAVDNLIDNSRRRQMILGANNRPLKSLSDIIKGKHGRFRQNLLGKRVDYSGRSVIVVGPELKVSQCGLPFEMAIELFQPFIIYELIKEGLTKSIKKAKELIKQRKSFVISILEKILLNHPIFLNRAPTLHRLGIQAFEPILVQGRAIQLHPLVCSAFNADFDGDQMAVHVPLSIEAKTECYKLMLSSNNFLSSTNGEPILMPSQDMVLGCSYLTMDGIFKSDYYFSNFKDALLAYNQKKIELHTLIWVRFDNLNFEHGKRIDFIKLSDQSYIEYYKDSQIRKDKLGTLIVQYIKTTSGRIIFNKNIQNILSQV